MVLGVDRLTKEAVDDLWASFNAPEDPVPSSSTVAPAAPKKITITVQYEFVGETVTCVVLRGSFRRRRRGRELTAACRTRSRQEKEVLADSDEAKAWLAKQKDSGTPVALPPTNSGPPPAAVDVKGKGPISAEDALFGTTDSASTQTPSAAASTSSSSTLPTPVPQPEPPKPAPRRAKGGGLSGLAAALGKPAKLNTLEKSKLDWKKYDLSLSSVGLSARKR